MDSKVPKGISHDILKRDINTLNVARTNGVLDIECSLLTRIYVVSNQLNTSARFQVEHEGVLRREFF